MFNQSARGNKLSNGLTASSSGVATSEFHVVRLQEVERNRVHAQGSGTQDGRSRAAPSYFVQSLQSICADVLAQNFSTTPEIDALQGEHAELYDMIIERLPVTVLPQEEEEKSSEAAAAAQQQQQQQRSSNANTDFSAPPSSLAFLPLNVAVPRVVSEAYWKRCCTARWSSGQLSTFTGGAKLLLEKQYGWKRLFLEQVLNCFLMSLRSGSTAPGGNSSEDAEFSQFAGKMGGTGSIGHSQSRTHTLGAPALFSSAIPGWSGGGGGDDGDGFRASQLSDEDARALADLCTACRDYVHTVYLPCQYTHLNWYEHFFSRLPGILDFRLSYGTTSVGIGYGKGMLGFSDHDAENLRHLLTRYTSLEALRLPQNRLSSAQAMMISSGLVGNTRLRVLDLSRNAVDDVAVTEGIALLLCQPEFPLEELNLNDNSITATGAKALADALAVNHTLAVLNVGQNRIGDAEGGAAIVRALAQNPQSPLKELNLGNNLLAEETVAALRDVLPGLRTLTALNVAGNRRIGSAGAGDALCEAVLNNSSLSFIDVRFCSLTAEQVHSIETTVQGRVERAASEVRTGNEEVQRDRIAEIVAGRPSGRY